MGGRGRESAGKRRAANNVFSLSSSFLHAHSPPLMGGPPFGFPSRYLEGKKRGGERVAREGCLPSLKLKQCRPLLEGMGRHWCDVSGNALRPAARSSPPFELVGVGNPGEEPCVFVSGEEGLMRGRRTGEDGVRRGDVLGVYRVRALLLWGEWMRGMGKLE